jgi:hypothetical protein
MLGSNPPSKPLEGHSTQENFPKISLLKVENFQLQNFFRRKICVGQSHLKKIFLLKIFLRGHAPLHLPDLTLAALCTKVSTNFKALGASRGSSGERPITVTRVNVSSMTGTSLITDRRKLNTWQDQEVIK